MSGQWILRVDEIVLGTEARNEKIRLIFRTKATKKVTMPSRLLDTAGSRETKAHLVIPKVLASLGVPLVRRKRGQAAKDVSSAKETEDIEEEAVRGWRKEKETN